MPDGNGGYRLISGNEMGVILLDFICRSRIANGTMPENPVAVTTIVSTDMVTTVAKKYGVELRRVLTGFKYIGEQIALLEQGGHPERYIPLALRRATGIPVRYARTRQGRGQRCAPHLRGCRVVR